MIPSAAALHPAPRAPPPPPPISPPPPLTLRAPQAQTSGRWPARRAGKAGAVSASTRCGSAEGPCCCCCPAGAQPQLPAARGHPTPQCIPDHRPTAPHHHRRRCHSRAGRAQRAERAASRAAASSPSSQQPAAPAARSSQPAAHQPLHARAEVPPRVPGRQRQVGAQLVHLHLAQHRLHINPVSVVGAQHLIGALPRGLRGRAAARSKQQAAGGSASQWGGRGGGAAGARHAARPGPRPGCRARAQARWQGARCCSAGARSPPWGRSGGAAAAACSEPRGGRRSCSAARRGGPPAHPPPQRGVLGVVEPHHVQQGGAAAAAAAAAAPATDATDAGHLAQLRAVGGDA
jgi:hypothetical protein